MKEQSVTSLENSYILSIENITEFDEEAKKKLNEFLDYLIKEAADTDEINYYEYLFSLWLTYSELTLRKFGKTEVASFPSHPYEKKLFLC